PNCRFRYQCDAAFALSDHADFPDLIELVKKVNPKRVLTLHGFAADFAQTLRDLGYDASPLSEEEQFTLAFGASAPRKTSGNQRQNKPRRPGKAEDDSEAAAQGGSVPSGHHLFSAFAEACSKI